MFRIRSGAGGDDVLTAVSQIQKDITICVRIAFFAAHSQFAHFRRFIETESDRISFLTEVSFLRGSGDLIIRKNTCPVSNHDFISDRGFNHSGRRIKVLITGYVIDFRIHSGMIAADIFFDSTGADPQDIRQMQ